MTEEPSTTFEQPARPPPLGEVLGPLPVWAVMATLGSLVGELLVSGLQPGEAAAVGAALFGAAQAFWPVLLTVMLRARRHEPADVPVLVGVLAAMTVAAVCAGGVAVRVATTSMGALPELADRGGRAEVLATVVAEPRRVATGWHVLVRVDEVNGMATRERAALTRDARDAGDGRDAQPPPLGSRWRARTSARPLPEGGYGRWLAGQHAAVVLDPRTWEAAGDPGLLAASTEAVRDRVRRAATRHLDDRVGGLLVGFVTGDTRRLPEAEQAEMRATGLTHLTAVSGSNLAILVAGVTGLAAALRVGAAGRRVTVAVVVPWFAFLTRFEPSVLRAGTMAALLLLASSRGHVRDARHALCGALLVLVLLDPRLAGSLGLLLSATATAGVLLVAPAIHGRLPDRLPRRVAELVSVTMGAQIAVVPLLLVTFGEVGLATIPANLIAVPAAAVAAAVAFVGTALSLVHVELGAVVFVVAGLPARVVLEAAHRFAGVGGTVEVARPATVVALVAVCLWLTVARGRRARRRTAVAAVLAVAVAVMPAVVGRLPPRGFTVTAIDVGQGDAFLIESPGARILVDAGPDDQASRWLRRHGRAHLDLLVVTHAHLDHIGGVTDVLDVVSVDALWMSEVPTELPEATAVPAAAVARGVAVRTPRAGATTVVGDVSVEVLHPPPGRPYRFARSELNESSLVLRFEHDGRRVLVTGDVEREAQLALLADVPERLRAELFTVPHHGSRTTDPAFLAAVGARTALISAGRGNRHGHPHAETLTVLHDLQVDVRRTDLLGTLRVDVPHAGPTATAPPDRSLASSDGARDPARRRRRPAVAAGARTAAGRVGGGGRRAHDRPLRRRGAGASAGAADDVAVRRTDLCGPPRARDAHSGQREGRDRALSGHPVARGGARACRPRGRQDPEDRQAGQGARRTDRRQGAGRLGRPWLGPARRRGVPAATTQGGRDGDRGDPRPCRR